MRRERTGRRRIQHYRLLLLLLRLRRRAGELLDFGELLFHGVLVAGIGSRLEILLQVRGRGSVVFFLRHDEAENVAGAGEPLLVGLVQALGALFGIIKLLEVEVGDGVVIERVGKVEGIQLDEAGGRVGDVFPFLLLQREHEEVAIRVDVLGIRRQGLGIRLARFLDVAFAFLDLAQFEPGG